jgi:hypothetical protein
MTREEHVTVEFTLESFDDANSITKMLVHFIEETIKRGEVLPLEIELHQYTIFEEQ